MGSAAPGSRGRAVNETLAPVRVEGSGWGSLLAVNNCLRGALEADPSGRRACLWRQRREEACPVCL